MAGAVVTCSVVVPHYNETELDIWITAKSALAAGATEVVLVDDGSDTSPFIPEHGLLRRVHIGHGGISAAINAGVRAASGQLVSFLSVGDGWDVNRIRDCVHHMHRAEVPAMFHDYRGGTTAPNWRERLSTDNQFCAGMVVVDREMFTEKGLWFDEGLQYCVDWDWACRVEYCGPTWHHWPVTLGVAREHPGGHTAGASSGPARRRRDRDRATVGRRWRLVRAGS